MVREGTALYGMDRFQAAKDAAEVVRPIFAYADREMLVVMSLDTRLTPIAMEIAAVGSINVCGVDMREVFKHAVLSNAAKIICFHNHPSGGLEASLEDSQVTGRNTSVLKNPGYIRSETGKERRNEEISIYTEFIP